MFAPPLRVYLFKITTECEISLISTLAYFIWIFLGVMGFLSLLFYALVNSFVIDDFGEGATFSFVLIMCSSHDHFFNMLQSFFLH